MVLVEVGLSFRLSLSSACCSRINASGEIWYLPARTQDLSKSTGSTLSFVKPSAIILLVGSQRTIPQVVRIDSLMITTSIDVRLSSMEVGAEGEIRWSYNDLQSVARIGGRVDSTSRACFRFKGPSRVSDMRRDNHSAAPVATDMACASPPNVELTARGSRYERQIAGVHEDTAPSFKSLFTKPTINPACVWFPKLAQAASEWTHKVSLDGGIGCYTISRSLCCFALLTALFAFFRSPTVGLGKHC